MTLTKSNHQHFVLFPFKSRLDIILNPFASLLHQFFVSVLYLQQFALSFFLKLQFFIWYLCLEKFQAEQLQLLINVTGFLKQLVIGVLEPFLFLG
jgi:hypothetical protein